MAMTAEARSEGCVGFSYLCSGEGEELSRQKE